MLPIALTVLIILSPVTQTVKAGMEMSPALLDIILPIAIGVLIAIPVSLCTSILLISLPRR